MTQDLWPLAAPLRDALTAHLERAWPREGCGLLLQAPCGEFLLQPCQNIAACDDQFELDPLELLRALRGGGALRAIYHSHCDRPPLLSARDLQRALLQGRPAWPGCDQLIVSVYQGRATDARRWRFDDAAGRFLPCPESPFTA